MSSLFTPYKLGPVTLRNRTVRSAAFESMGRHFGPTEQLKEYHVSVARGGVGMTTLAYAAVCRSGLSFDKQLWLRPEIVPGLRGITDAVHREGAAAGIQIGHCGNMTHLTTAGQIPIGASTGFNLYAYTPVRGMRKDEIAQVARDFGKAVHTAHDAGFDSVEVHAGHGYLISQFLSPYTNHRKDEYGGTLENRMRFMRMCLTEVMEAAAKTGTAVLVKHNMYDGFKGGIEIPESIAIAREIERFGVDGIVLSGGFVSKAPMAVMRGLIPIYTMSAPVAALFHPLVRALHDPAVSLRGVLFPGRRQEIPRRAEMPAGICRRAGEPRRDRQGAGRRVRTGADGPGAGQRPGVRKQAPRGRRLDTQRLRPPQLLHRADVLGGHEMLQALRRAATQDTGRTGQTAVSMEHMEKRKRNSETAGAAAQGGTPAGSRKHAAEPQGRRMERGAVAPGSAWALVTGAGSGIGRCYALRLAALGYRLVIAGDNRAPLEAVAEEIRNARPAGRKAAAKEPEAAEGSEVAKKSKVAEGLGVAASADGSGAPGREPAAAIAEATGEPGAETDGNGALAAGSAQQGVGSGKECGNRATAAVTPDVRVIAIDLARVGAAQELYDRMTAEGIVVDVVINNAGIFSFCDILATPAERIERIILLHDLTVTQLCRLFAADMVRRGVRGHILNMSSYSLWMPFPGLALYSASKAYMRSFSVAFAKEVRERGIRVTALCPAGVATDLYGLTPYWQRIGCKLGVLITPDSCARRGLKALWRGRRCIVPDWWNRAWIPFCKVLPMWVLRPVRRFTMKFQK